MCWNGKREYYPIKEEALQPESQKTQDVKLSNMMNVSTAERKENEGSHGFRVMCKVNYVFDAVESLIQSSQVWVMC